MQESPQCKYTKRQKKSIHFLNGRIFLTFKSKILHSIFSLKVQTYGVTQKMCYFADHNCLWSPYKIHRRFTTDRLNSFAAKYFYIYMVTLTTLTQVYSQMFFSLHSKGYVGDGFGLPRYWNYLLNKFCESVWLDKTSGTFFMIAAIFSKLLCNLREVQYFIDGIRRPLNLSNDEKSYMLKNMIGIGRIKLIVTEAGISMHVAYSKGTNLRHSGRHKVSHFFGIITNLFMFETLREKITCTERIKNRKKNPQETYLVKCYRNCKRFDYITT